MVAIFRTPESGAHHVYPSDELRGVGAKVCVGCPSNGSMMSRWLHWRSFGTVLEISIARSHKNPSISPTNGGNDGSLYTINEYALLGRMDAIK